MPRRFPSLLAVLPLFFLSSCATISALGPFDSPEVISRLKEPTVIEPLRRAKIGYLDFVPLPQNYPSGYVAHERVFTGEVYSRDPSSSLPSPDLRFVPKDYPRILESAFSQALSASGVTPTKYSSIREARSAGCELLVIAAPLAFHVDDESKAAVGIFYKVYVPRERKTLWEGRIETEFVHTGVPRSITGRALVFLVGSHEYNFQPQRTLLAAAAFNNALEFLTRIAAAITPAIK